MRLHRLAIACGISSFALAAPTLAQVTLDSSAIQTSASASTPSCLDNGTGGPGIPTGSASCTGPVGYTATAGATADFVLDPSGATLSASAQAAATAPGGVPVQNSNGNASGLSSGSWTATSDTHYSVSVSGDASTAITGAGGALPPSGVIATGGPFAISLSASAFAFARDSGPLSAAEASGGEARVTFAPVGASDLIMGTVLAAGAPMAGLSVEALDAGTPIAATRSASDGSYLLPGIPVPVVLRLSDPAGRFVTELSPLLAPPATWDADLAPVPAPLPALGGAGALALAIGLGWAGARRLRRRRR